MTRTEQRDREILEILSQMCEAYNIPVYYHSDEQEAYLTLTDDKDQGIWIGAASNPVIEAEGQVLIDKEQGDERIAFPDLKTWNEMNNKTEWIKENLFMPIYKENMLLETGREHNFDFVVNEDLNLYQYELPEEWTSPEERYMTNEGNFIFINKFCSYEAA